MNILFVIPSTINHHQRKGLRSRMGARLFLAPPLTFPMLAANTPPQHHLRLIDELTEPIDFNVHYDLVGITAMTPDIPRAYELADEFRKRGIRVVLGGWHPTLYPDEALQHADSVVCGEGEEIWPQLLNDLEHERLKPRYQNETPVDFAAQPPPNRNLLHRRGFLFNDVQATRGCPMGCTFCAVTHQTIGRNCRYRPVENIVKEIDVLPRKYFLFVDSTLTQNIAYTKTLFTALRNSRKRFSCNGNVSTLYKDDELLRLSVEAGCREWTIGFESLSQDSLNMLGKHGNRVEEFKPAIRKIHDYGLAVAGNFIFGADGDRPGIFQQTIDAINTWDIDLPAFSILTPLPGTPLFENLEQDGRLLTKDWSLYDCRHVVFQPRHFTVEALALEYEDARCTVFSSYQNLHRAIHCLDYGWSSLFLTGAVNFFS